MSHPSGQTIYLKIPQNCVVTQQKVLLRDIAELTGSDIGILRRVRQVELYRFPGSPEKEKSGFERSGFRKNEQLCVMSVLYVVQEIQKLYPTLEINIAGEPDFVIRYVAQPERKWVQYLKVTLLCGVLFFGSAFTIMTFIEDVSVTSVFQKFYLQITGQTSNGKTLLEISFCIGLSVGILIFYNHVGKKKLTDDPTPIQVAMRKYEQDVDTTYIETAGRKGKSVDVDS